MSKEIPLSRGKVAVVDDADYEWLKQWKWYARKSYEGKNHTTFYAIRKIQTGHGAKTRKRITIRMHRLILNAPLNLEVDHKNHDGLDNHRENLRLATRLQNQMNARPEQLSSKYKGVHWQTRSQRWIAKIMLNNKKYHVGAFRDEIRAAKAYDEVAKRLFGEFACTNF